MYRKSFLQFGMVGVLVVLIATFFVVSLTVCDDKEAELGTQQIFSILDLPSYFDYGFKQTPSFKITLIGEDARPNSAILYLELHETSPPTISL